MGEDNVIEASTHLPPGFASDGQFKCWIPIPQTSQKPLPDMGAKSFHAAESDLVQPPSGPRNSAQRYKKQVICSVGMSGCSQTPSRKP